MSLLGFDALGRWALGQLPSTRNFLLLAAQGSSSLAGRPVAFVTSGRGAAASFVETGLSTGFKIGQPGNPGSYVFASNAATIRFRQASFVGSFSLTGAAANMRVRLVASTGGILLSGASVPYLTSLASGPGAFAWTGGNSSYDHDHEAWVRRPFETMSWQVETTLPSPTWNGAVEPASAWAAHAQPGNAWIQASIEPEPWTTE